MLLFINNFFNIKKKEMKIYIFLKKSWLALKLKVFFTTNKKKIVGQTVNRGSTQASLNGHGSNGLS